MSKKITPEILNTIANLSRSGFTQYYIANTIGVSDTTLSRWKQENPEVANALSVSSDGILSDVKSRLVHIATNGADKDAISASTFLLNRYESVEPEGDVEPTSDEEIKQSILDELNG